MRVGSGSLRSCARVLLSRPLVLLVATMPKSKSLRSLAISTSTITPRRDSPPSPTFSEGTNASSMNFGDRTSPSKIITRADLKQSTQAFESVRSLFAFTSIALLIARSC